MIDTSGSFDPRNLIKKQPPGIGMQTSAPQTPVHSNGIPDVAPYQPIGNGILPTVPFGGQKSNLPQHTNPSSSAGVLMNQSTPQTPISMNRSAQVNVAPQVQPQAPSIPSPQIQPPSQGGNPLRAQIDKFLAENPGDIGRAASALEVSQGEIDAAMGSAPGYTNPSASPSNDVRLDYGFNDNQWALNRAAESAADRSGIDFANPGSAGNPYNMSREQWLRGNPSLGWYGGTDPRNPAGFMPGLPDEAAWRARRAEALAPFNASVASERAAGRPGHSGLVPQAQPNITPQNTLPNYVNPNISPVAPQIQPTAPIADDRWTGTQTRRPQYF